MPTDAANYDSAEEYIQAIVETLPQPKKKYTEVNPFYFDQEAAREYAEAEFSPYYDEILSDYMTDVSIQQERLGEDQDRFLSYMEADKQAFMENQGEDLDRTLRNVKRGYSGKGLYFSGFKSKALGEERMDYQDRLDDYMRNYKQDVSGRQIQTQRSLEDLTRGAKRKRRDIERQEEAAITGQILKRRGEKLDQYNIGLQTYYQNPNWGAMI